MHEKDHVTVFVSQIQEKYKEACDLYSVNKLPKSLNFVIAHTVTMNMNTVGRALYYTDILKNPLETVEEMEKSLRKDKFRHSLFELSHNETNTEEHGTPKILTDNSSVNDYQNRRPRRKCNNAWARRTRPYRKSRCWFFNGPGGCWYGNSCWFDHK